MYATPKPGRSVPIPGTRQLLPVTGQNIGPMTQYWQRRLADGDIAVSERAPTSSAATASTTTTSSNTQATASLDEQKGKSQ